MIKYTIHLSKSEREELMGIISKGSHTSQTFRSAYILLNCDEGKYAEQITNEQISKVLKVGMRTIDRVKKRFVEEGMESTLERKPPSRSYDVKVDGDVETRLVTLRCSEPPKGYARWSLRLLYLLDIEFTLKYLFIEMISANGFNDICMNLSDSD